MEALLAVAVVLVALAAFALLPRLVSRERRKQARNVQAGVIGAGLDEIFHPHARKGRLEREQQHEAPAPAPAPDDPLETGRIRLDL